GREAQDHRVARIKLHVCGAIQIGMSRAAYGISDLICLRERLVPAGSRCIGGTVLGRACDIGYANTGDKGRFQQITVSAPAKFLAADLTFASCPTKSGID